MKRFCEETVSLDGEWELCYVSDSRLKQDGYRNRRDASLSTPALNTLEALLRTGYDRIPARVPGNFEWELYRAGKTEDPFFGTNVLRLQELEGMHQYYFRRFRWSGDSRNVFLCLEGIDTAAEVFLNGRRLLTCDNMFLEHRAEVEEWLSEGENCLVVHIKPAVLYARQYADADMTFALPYNYEGLHLRKAASSFGWDIMPRIAGGGIWRSVSLIRQPENRIADLFGYTLSANPETGAATLAFSFAVEVQTDLLRDWTLTVEGVCGSSRFSCGGGLRHTCGRLTAELKDACFWMPRNYGEARLYDIRAELRCRGELADAVGFRLGIRTVELERDSVVSGEKGNGVFAFRINGRRIFAMGTNWVPADAFHSRDRERLRELLPMLNDLGCNMVRCWGGNVYEHEDFFDFCDENGILIWQDFAMGCAVYPQDVSFAEQIRREAGQIVRKYRNHPALALWAGDNECDLACDWSGVRRDPNQNRLTREVLPEVLRQLDLTRPYLPSSPYIDSTVFRTGLPPAEDHIWGPRDDFKGAYYAGAACGFASEIGYHGCPEPSSLRRFLSKERIWGWRREDGTGANDEWLVHAACMEPDPKSQYAYRIPLMAQQVRNLFGEEPDTLEDFAAESQISQAEADKFFIERFRIANPRRGGILWWNLADGWPQVSDAVVDYYGRKKLAYFYIRRSQAPLALICGEPENGEIRLYAVSDLQSPVSLSFRVRDLNSGSVLQTGTAEVEANSLSCLARLPHRKGDQRFYLMAWEYLLEGQKQTGCNHFVSGLNRTLRLDTYLGWMRCAGFFREFFLADSALENGQI